VWRVACNKNFFGLFVVFIVYKRIKYKPHAPALDPTNKL